MIMITYKLNDSTVRLRPNWSSIFDVATKIPSTLYQWWILLNFEQSSQSKIQTRNHKYETINNSIFIYLLLMFSCIVMMDRVNVDNKKNIWSLLETIITFIWTIESNSFKFYLFLLVVNSNMKLTSPKVIELHKVNHIPID